MIISVGMFKFVLVQRRLIPFSLHGTMIFFRTVSPDEIACNLSFGDGPE